MEKGVCKAAATAINVAVSRYYFGTSESVSCSIDGFLKDDKSCAKSVKALNHLIASYRHVFSSRYRRSSGSGRLRV
jgi:hypothetical protein